MRIENRPGTPRAAGPVLSNLVKRGVRVTMTREDEERLALLASILKTGGGGSKAQILDTLERLDLLRLSDRDLEVMGRNELRWRNRLAFVRHHLVLEGYVSDRIRDDWRITEEGCTYAAALAKRAASEGEGSFVRIGQAANIITAAGAPMLNDEAAVNKETVGEEGTPRRSWTAKYERDPELRRAAIRAHGTCCMGCGFSFADAYGEWGVGFIEVHHLNPVSALGGASQVRADKDLVVLCSNCHSVVHRRKNQPLSMQELKSIIQPTGRSRRGAPVAQE